MGLSQGRGEKGLQLEGTECAKALRPGRPPQTRTLRVLCKAEVQDPRQGACRG